jgi:cytochrome c-type biogenesis protein
MSFLPEIANPYVAALGTGFLYGLVFCTSTCLPYVASYIAGINADFRKGVAVTAFFNGGRVTAYALLGAAIGALKLLIDTSFQPVFQTYTSIIFSVVTVIIGITLLVRNKPPSCDCIAGEIQKPSKHRLVDRFDVRAYVLGLTRGLLLCGPLIGILTLAATFGSPLDSFLLALLFGIGTALSPMLLLGGVTGWLLNKAPLFRVWISRFGAVALVVLGAITLYYAIIK